VARRSVPWYSNEMSLPHSRLTLQGQISVPADVRRRLELTPGSVLEWDVAGDTVLVRRVGTHTSQDVAQALFEGVPARRSLEEIQEGPARHARERHARR
jgi:AbrB family looped-hinge helix DNA binding protein